jgi:hypothetical protein
VFASFARRRLARHCHHAALQGHAPPRPRPVRARRRLLPSAPHSPHDELLQLGWVPDLLVVSCAMKKVPSSLSSLAGTPAECIDLRRAEVPLTDRAYLDHRSMRRLRASTPPSSASNFPIHARAITARKPTASSTSTSARHCPRLLCVFIDNLQCLPAASRGTTSFTITTPMIEMLKYNANHFVSLTIQSHLSVPNIGA